MIEIHLWRRHKLHHCYSKSHEVGWRSVVHWFAVVIIVLVSLRSNVIYPYIWGLFHCHCQSKNAWLPQCQCVVTLKRVGKLTMAWPRLITTKRENVHDFGDARNLYLPITPTYITINDTNISYQHLFQDCFVSQISKLCFLLWIICCNKSKLFVPLRFWWCNSISTLYKVAVLPLMHALLNSLYPSDIINPPENIYKRLWNTSDVSRRNFSHFDLEQWVEYGLFLFVNL